jgi:hypothetical protein
MVALQARRLLGVVFTVLVFSAAGVGARAQTVAPLLSPGHPVGWWFAYKFNAGTFPTPLPGPGPCAFGGQPQSYAMSLRYVTASSEDATLRDGAGLIGSGPADPLGATFGEIYNGKAYYVAWNDQFLTSPSINKPGCTQQGCNSPWGHSKGILAWDKNGNGLILQVTTPAWPASGSAAYPRPGGNTLGCMADKNNVTNAQHFFALALSHDDVAAVLKGLARASVATDVTNPQIAGRLVDGEPGPADLDALVLALGQNRPSPDADFIDTNLSSGVRLLVKPSALHVPPWQFVSARLGAPLRSATWWTKPKIATTVDGQPIGCWSSSIGADQRGVQIATSGRWTGVPLNLKGPPNHGKIGVSTDVSRPYVVLGDLNQQGELADTEGKCDASQNGRGGMFFVLENPALAQGVSALIDGDTAPSK